MPLDTSGELSPHNISEETLSQLPDDMQAMIIKAQIDRQRLIDALGAAWSKRRDAAVKYKNASGIETDWWEDEEFYDGIDDANRGEVKYLKPRHPSGVLTQKKTKQKGGSSVFMNITRQYVDSAAASVSEMGNPNDDRNFSIRAMPSPEITQHDGDETPHPATDDSGQPVQATLGDFAAQERTQLQKKADLCQDQIDTWLLKGDWHSHMRRAVHDSAKVGTGVMKGPVPSIFKGKKSIKNADGSTGLDVEEEMLPASKRISCWDCFPAPDCGDDIQQGSYFLERDYVNARTLRDMKMLPGYLPQQIDKVLIAGPQHNKEVLSKRNDNTVAEDNEEYEIWYGYGQLKREEIEAMGVVETLEMSEEDLDKKALQRIELLEACPCVVTMANDVPIKVTLNPLDSGEYPYDFICWEKRTNSPWGRGIARIMRTAQRITTAALRNLMDNAALSGGVQIGFKKGAVKPMGNDWKLRSITYWELTEDDVKMGDVLSFTQIPSIQKELMEIIQFGQKMAEDVTGMPLLLQGQTGSAPDTVGGMQLLNKNASSTRRMVARRIDDEMTKPHIRRYYQWVLMYGEESIKGEYQIDARGSQALVERDINRQFSIQMVTNAANPIFGIDPYKAMRETLRAEMINPDNWQFTEDIYKQNMQKAQQSGEPAIQVAQIRAASAEKIANAEITADAQDTQVKANASVAAVQERTKRDDEFARAKLDAESSLKERELEITREIAILNYSTSQKISLNEAKTQLATTSMKLQTEKELAATDTQMQAALHVSGQVQEHHQNLQANAADAATTGKQQIHERNLELMKQRHAKEMDAAQHQHAIDLQPAVQVPGRAANGKKLSQVSAKKNRRT